MKIIKLKENQRKICENILRSLPEWFGIEKAILNYLDDIDKLKTFAIQDNKHILGFLTLKHHFEHAAEIHVMAIHRDKLRQGLGKKLLSHVESYLTSRMVGYLHVKTLGPSHPDTNYQATRAFYHANGFKPIEENNTIWGKDTPCLIMIKKL